MDDAVQTRFKLIYESIQSCISTAQCALLTLGNSDIKEIELINIKLKAANQRFVSEIYNYCKFIREPNPDQIKEYTSVQLQAENLLAEIDFHIIQNNRDKIKASSDGLSSRLPKMELAKFDGDVLKWYQFWDQFSSNVDCRNISDVDKLLYLQSVLEGNAKQAIEGLDTTNKNYRIAVDTLKERYGRPSSIIDAHYVALYRIKTAPSNQIGQCRQILNEIERHLRVLGSLGEDVNHNHLRVMIIEKFSEDIIYELRLKMTGQEETIDNIRKNLEYIISARESSNRLRKYTFNTENENKGFDNFTIGALHVKSNENEDYSLQKITSVNKIKPKLFKNQFNKNYKTFSRKRPNDNCGRIDEQPKRKISKCTFCKQGHFNDECHTYPSVRERKSKLGNRCYNCFNIGHRANECRAKRKCKHCRKFGVHNRALCPVKLSQIEKPTTTSILHIKSSTNNILLQTCLVDVCNSETDTVHLRCRVLLDCGSQRSYVTESIANVLALSVVEKVNLSIFTFGTVSPREMESPVVKFRLTTRTGIERILYANVVPHITNSVLPPMFDNPATIWNDIRLKGLTFADDGSYGDGVNILIGNDYYSSFMSQEKILVRDELFLINTDFGWVWSGKVGEIRECLDNLSVLTYYQSNPVIDSKFNEPDLPIRIEDVMRLWDLESIGISDSPKSTYDEEAVKQFNETVQFSDNRYNVKWPWIEFPPNLADNLGLAWGRLNSLLKRLQSSEIEAYDNVIQNQLQTGIIEIVSDHTTSQTHPIHYLPHHCVYSRDKPTKLRIVYDASAKSLGNRSLNECLYRGPLMLEDLTRLLVKFRQYPIGIVADVEKAFLQLGLQSADRDVTRFLWLKNKHYGPSQDNILHLRFCRVPFGVISSPFLLNATIRLHLLKNSRRMCQLAEDIYVDNIVTGAETTSDALNLYSETKRTFDSLSMNLREWNSNSEQLLHIIPKELKQNSKLVKILGIMWDVEKDRLSLRVAINTEDKIETKRDVLKCIASFYDPCGFAVPVILPAKLFFQSLWKEKIKWDVILNNELLSEWNKIKSKFTYLEKITINRYYRYGLNVDDAFNNVEHELHCFTDSSMEAYAAVIYLRSSSHTNNIVSFVIGKSRLVPLKNKNNLQIPKLELLGVLIGSRLMNYVTKSLNMNIKSQFLWTDSQVVISWCKSEKLLPPFVSRRVNEIKQNKALQIRYVPTKLNPADVATRPEQVDLYDQWIKGPKFLELETDQWPKGRNYNNHIVGVHSFLAEEGLSNTDTIKEVREINRQNTNGEIGNIRKIQLNYFTKEVKGYETDLSRGLKLYKDEEGILRCKGRFRYTDLTFDQKEPILLPRESEFTHKVIKDLHEKNFHVGVSHTLALLRKKFWVPRGRSTVQKVIRRCTQCIKYGGGPFKLPDMPDLPKERVKLFLPFAFTGIDYFGPFYVKSTCNEKRWICLFTCLTIRAIHLEVVKDLSAEECLLAIRRFIAVRGLPCLIISDNATQFKLTAEVVISDYCIKNNVHWKFIPELAPWFGGFYERLIGLVKHSLKRSLDKHLLNQNQLLTIMKEIEAVINTRPLTAVGSEIEHVLTPADFLRVGGALTTDISEEDFLESATITKTNLVDGWKRGQIILQEFARMFHNQYLTSLRERRDKHRQPRVIIKRAPRLDEVVQIRADINRAHWKVGKIVELLKGSDGQIRVAKVKVLSGEMYTRSVGQLFPLEIEDQYTASSHDEYGLARRQKTIQDSQINEPNKLIQSSTSRSTATSEATQERSSRSSAVKARELVKQWTSQLLTMS